MSKRKARAYVRLGRPPRDGEWCVYAPWGNTYQAGPEAHKGEEAISWHDVEVEVPELPLWIEDLGGPDVPYSLLQSFAAAFRAHVEKCWEKALRPNPSVTMLDTFKRELLK